MLRASRTTFRYIRTRPQDEPVIVRRMTEIAQTRVRYGDRRIHILMQREGWRINHKLSLIHI